MNNFFKKVFFLVNAIIFLSIFVAVQTVGAEEMSATSIYLSQHKIVFKLKVENNGTILSVNGPGNTYFRKWFDKGIDPVFKLRDNFGKLFPDGTCTYELSALPILDDKTQKIFDEIRAQQGSSSEVTFEPDDVASEKYFQSGTFYIEGSKITGTSATALQSGTDRDSVREIDGDQVILDDLIVDGSACIGFDCVNGESFGFDTIRLKENNLRIRFQDTSSTASFPSNDWQITANDSSNGGLNKFSIDDIDHGTTPFTIEAGANSYSLYIDDYDRVGLGTSTPVVELHIKDSDTPTVRLEQDGSSGWSPQTWDVAGNEANFFIRDVTNGSTLPFRIQPSTPSNTLCLMSDGKVGIGTWSPDYPMELETTGKSALFVATRTDGATVQFSAGVNDTYFGSRSNHDLQLIVNQQNKMTIDTAGNVGINEENPTHRLHVDGDIYATGSITDGSSRELKENIRELSLEESLLAVAELQPVRFNYKANKKEEKVGFIAEDVPELVATVKRNGISAIDVTAVLTKVIQEQQRIIEDLTVRLTEIEKKLK